jgi:hypothetical protein
MDRCSATCKVSQSAIKFCLLCLIVAIFAVASAETMTLERLNVHGSITVSGLSSGAYMAVQMHVSHSANINGSAIFAGGPFYCAESNIEYATHKCMDQSLGPPETDKLIALTSTDAALGYVDNPSHLKNSRVYLFSGKDDSVVDQRVMKALQQYYMAFIPAPQNIAADFNIAAEHCIPTLNYGEDCTTLASPYIGKCDFDGAGKAFLHLFGDDLVRPTSSAIASGGIPENLHKFDQKPFFTDDHLNSIGDEGYIYIPSACAKGAGRAAGARASASCRLHMSFHGCEQNLDILGNAYAAHSGFNPWAEANNIVVVYPYVKTSPSVPYNPKGCWDWWAYTGVNYGTKSGVQVKFARSILERVGGPFAA